MVEVKASLAHQQNRLFAEVPPAAIREIDVQLSKVPGIVKLTIGEPDFPAPEEVKEAVKIAVDNDDSHYAPAQGTEALRQAISTYIQERLQTPAYDPDGEITVTVGAAEALYITLSSLFNAGDTILIPTPTFSFYQAAAIRLGLKVVEINTAPDFLFTADKFEETIKAHPEAKGLILNYPGNPTGVTYEDDQLEALAKAIEKTDLIVMSDEIYAELSYGHQHRSITSLIPGQSILISGLSKSHAMTGYRVGFVAGPKVLMKAIGQAHSGIVAAAPSPIMAGAVAALTEATDAPIKMQKVYEERRDLVLSGLKEAGYEVPTPKGAFYAFAKIPAFLNQNDQEFVIDLANEAKVGTIPGSVFGAGGEGYIRLSYAASTKDLQEAMKRLIAYSKQAQANH